MEQRDVRWLRAVTAVAVAGTAVVVAAFTAMLLRQRSVEVQYGLFLFQNGPSAVVLLWMGRLVLRRQQRNIAGWVLVAIGVIQVLHTVVSVWADMELVAAGFTAPVTQIAEGLAPADLPPAAAIPLWVTGWLWVPAPVLAATVLLLAFPDGTLSGRAWRPIVGAATTGGGLLMVAFAIDRWPTAGWTTPEGAPAIVRILLAPGGLLVAVAVAASIGSLLRRWRRAGGTQRQPFRVAGVTAIGFAAIAVLTYPWQHIWIPAILVSFNLLIVGYALAVARYRLHDLEPVLGRAAVAAVVSLLVAAVCATVLIGATSLVGQRVDSRLLTLAAAAAAALLVEPARRRTRKLVDQLIFRRSADRTEVMSRLAAHANAASAADVLAEVTGLLVRSTGAARAEVHLAADPYPPSTDTAAASQLPVLRAAVQHQGETFGEVRLYATARADLVPDAPQLLNDVAHTLGIVLRNDRLTTQLQAQLDELQASRRRLVEAHDHARRGLERDIHDGAQTRLISLRIRLATLRAHLDRDSDTLRLTTELDDIGNDVDAAVRSLRALARGLHPPLLEQAGLTAALRAHARDLPVSVSVTARGVDRYPRAIEAAAYFCCLEAIQNAIRHSSATTITIDLTADDSRLCFQVGDNGIGFDPTRTLAGTGLANIDDRLSALGGQAHIHSRPGRGTRVNGAIPAQALTGA
ncbi:sensor histidine kinase [Planotetraspora mira]|uniref:Histidine kinase domain-containing protein n=1 Tax=Planotetraspora mira TaxID=58121 RepID=A0A8J3TZS1_9ACTN|nr:ATP-binding protein [Planotetraspora mira]GII33419.1 hypothetical protein Pmi06nite_68610 [Planotetraspora mira]